MNMHWSQWHAESFEFPITVFEWTDVGINHFYYGCEFKTNEPIQEQGQRGGAVEFPYIFSSQLSTLLSQALRSRAKQASLCAGGVVGLVEVTSDPSE